MIAKQDITTSAQEFFNKIITTLEQTRTFNSTKEGIMWQLILIYTKNFDDLYETIKRISREHIQRIEKQQLWQTTFAAQIINYFSTATDQKNTNRLIIPDNNKLDLHEINKLQNFLQKYFININEDTKLFYEIEEDTLKINNINTYRHFIYQDKHKSKIVDLIVKDYIEFMLIMTHIKNKQYPFPIIISLYQGYFDIHELYHVDALLVQQNMIYFAGDNLETPRQLKLLVDFCHYNVSLPVSSAFTSSAFTLNSKNIVFQKDLKSCSLYAEYFRRRMNKTDLTKLQTINKKKLNTIKLAINKQSKCNISYDLDTVRVKHKQILFYNISLLPSLNKFVAQSQTTAYIALNQYLLNNKQPTQTTNNKTHMSLFKKYKKKIDRQTLYQKIYNNYITLLQNIYNDKTKSLNQQLLMIEEQIQEAKQQTEPNCLMHHDKENILEEAQRLSQACIKPFNTIFENTLQQKNIDIYNACDENTLRKLDRQKHVFFKQYILATPEDQLKFTEACNKFIDKQLIGINANNYNVFKKQKLS